MDECTPLKETIFLLEPKNIRFTQQSISDKLSKPKAGETKKKHLESLVADLSTGKDSIQNFPPIIVFSVFDSENYEEITYSLSNRKLFLARKSNAEEIKSTFATFDEILSSTWKWTNENDGITFPVISETPKKESRPTYGMLCMLRNFFDSRLNNRVVSELSLEEKNGIYEEASEKFKLKCIL